MSFPVYQLYRSSTLGSTLEESLSELMQAGRINQQHTTKILHLFDKAVNKALATRISTIVIFKAEKIHFYRYCDNVWTFELNNVDIKSFEGLNVNVSRLKIVACDGFSRSNKSESQ